MIQMSKMGSTKNMPRRNIKNAYYDRISKDVMNQTALDLMKPSSESMSLVHDDILYKSP